MKTADIEQIHSLWVTMWNYTTRFSGILCSEKVHQAMLNLNDTSKHPFWGKLKEALGTLVSVPEHKHVTLIKLASDDPRFYSKRVFTKDYLKHTIIDIPKELAHEFVFEQLPVRVDEEYRRYFYDTGDFYVLGKIEQIFPKEYLTPFCYDDGVVWKRHIYSLQIIEEFVAKATAVVPTSESAIIDSSVENIFWVQGKNGPLMISVRQKLGRWQMRRVQVGNTFRGIGVYFFI